MRKSITILTSSSVAFALLNNTFSIRINAVAVGNNHPFYGGRKSAALYRRIIKLVAGKQ